MRRVSDKEEWMKGVVLLGDGELAVKEFEDPKPGRGEVVVRTKAAGICGSDIHMLHSPKKRHEGRPEMIAGHEGAGIIEEIGEGVTMVEPGNRVSIYHYIGCGKCRHCLAGYRQWCRETKGMGLGVHGADADFILTKEDNCYVMPEELSFIDGAFMACGAGTAYSALSKLRPNGTSTLAVFGLGPVGLAGVIMAKAMGAQVVAIGRRICGWRWPANWARTSSSTPTIPTLRKPSGDCSPRALTWHSRPPALPKRTGIWFRYCGGAGTGSWWPVEGQRTA